MTAATRACARTSPPWPSSGAWRWRSPGSTTIGDRALLPTDLYLRMQPWRAHAREFNAPAQVSNPILDAVQQFYPWRLYAARQVRQGVVPLWTPLMLSGHPFVANNQSAVFYPETWLHYLIRPLKALGWATLAFLIIAGSTMYAFLRTIGVRPTAAAVGGVSFMLCGFFVGWLMFPTARSTGAWLPLMLLGFERSVRSGRRSWLGLTAFGDGHGLPRRAPAHRHLRAARLRALRGNFGSSAWRWTACAGRGWRATRRWPWCGAGSRCDCWRPASSPRLRADRAVDSRIAGVDYPDLVRQRAGPAATALGLMPDIFGNPADGNHWGGDLNAWWGRSPRAYTETALVPRRRAAAAGLAGLALRPRRQSWFWLGLLVFALLLAFGTPANLLLRYLVPGLPAADGHQGVACLACTAGAVLGALGMDALMRAGEQAARALTA